MELRYFVGINDGGYIKNITKDKKSPIEAIKESILKGLSPEDFIDEGADLYQIGKNTRDNFKAEIVDWRRYWR